MNTMLDSEYLILVYYNLTQEPTPFLRKLKTNDVVYVGLPNTSLIIVEFVLYLFWL